MNRRWISLVAVAMLLLMTTAALPAQSRAQATPIMTQPAPSITINGSTDLVVLLTDVSAVFVQGTGFTPLGRVDRMWYDDVTDCSGPTYPYSDGSADAAGDIEFGYGVNTLGVKSVQYEDETTGALSNCVGILQVENEATATAAPMVTATASAVAPTQTFVAGATQTSVVIATQTESAAETQTASVPTATATRLPADPIITVNGQASPLIVTQPLIITINGSGFAPNAPLIANSFISTDCSGEPLGFVPFATSDTGTFSLTLPFSFPSPVSLQFADGSGNTSNCFAIYPDAWVATATAEAILSATATSTATAIDTATATSTATAIDTATATSTATAIDTATATSTTTPAPIVDTATSAPPSAGTATAAPTEIATSTNTPLATPIVDLPTDTPVATAPIEPTEPTTGDAAITLVTADGGAIPDDTQVCVAGQCQSTAGYHLAGLLALASGNVFAFTGLPLGTQPVSVTTGGIAVLTASIDIEPGQVASLTLTYPSAPSTLPTSAPIGGGAPPSQPTGAAVTTLPNTGSGNTGNAPYVLLALAALIMLGTALISFRRREG